MLASDVMTREVVTTTAGTPVHEVARILLAHGISALPVVDADARPVGMVSEGDLVNRDEAARLAWQDWWLKLLADEVEPGPDDLAKLRSSALTASDVMAAPVVAVSEDTPLGDIARLLAEHRIKRVPVVKDGCITGIVSRADLLRAFTTDRTEPAARAPHQGGFLGSMFAMLAPSHRSSATEPAQPQAPPDRAAALTAETFRDLIEDFHADKDREHDALRQAAIDRRRKLTAELIDTHVTDETWKALLHRAEQAAAVGEKQCLLLRFPNALCSDGGRAINVVEDGWPGTLRGEAAELYLRWERDLKPRGFHLSAQVLEFPGGKPGDIGLFLIWGERG